MANTQSQSVESIRIMGERVPALGLGTWQLTGDACAEAVEHALSIGYRHVDTAQMYENEAQVGEGMKRSGVDRDEIFLTTKIAPENVAPDKARASAERSLKRLGTDRVDLLLIHWPSNEVPIADTLAVMRDLQSEGKTRRIGVSNFPPSHVREAAEHAEVFCNQVEHHPFLAQDKLLEQSREMGYLLTAYCPLARGEVMRNETLREIGAAHGKAPAQVALRWLVQRGVCAIPKASKAEHREANFAIFGFDLAEDEVDRIDRLDRGERLIDPSWGPDWER